MAKTETDKFGAFTKRAKEIIANLAPAFGSITKEVQALAVVVADVRASITREVKSKKTEKAVNVPDWDGRSPSYREWFNDTLLPMIAEKIPVEYQGTIRTRLQNAVQEEVKKRATPAQKAHLGLTNVSKSATQNKKRTAAKANDARQSDEAFSTDALVAHVKETPIADAAQDIAAQCEALLLRVKAKDNGLTPAQSKKTSTLLAQAMQYLMSARSAVDPKVKDAVQAKTAKTEKAAA